MNHQFIITQQFYDANKYRHLLQIVAFSCFINCKSTAHISQSIWVNNTRKEQKKLYCFIVYINKCCSNSKAHTHNRPPQFHKSTHQIGEKRIIYFNSMNWIYHIFRFPVVIWMIFFAACGKSACDGNVFSGFFCF